MFAYLSTCLLLLFPPHMQDGFINPMLHLVSEGKEWHYDLSNTGFDGIDPTTMNRSLLHQWFSKIAKQVEQQPRSSFYRDRKLVPHRLGKKVHIEEMDRWADMIHEYMGKEIAVPYSLIQPKLTTEELKQLKRHLLATYTTRYNEQIINRTHNLKLSTRAIDHKVVMPGEIFSFNQVVGQRTIARGYREAKIIVKGEYSEGVGGGICQTSSTLFNSVERAGLKIVERVSHSREVPYVSKGRDATVSWYGPDFKFANTLHKPILIVSEAKKGRLRIFIYSN